MISNDEPRMSEGDRRRSREYLREFLPGMIGYVVAIAVIVGVVDERPTTANRLLAMLPLVPSLWAMRAIVRMIRRSDELVRSVHYRAMSVGFGAAMMAALATGLFSIPGDTGLFGRLAPWLIFSVGMMGWALASGVLAARQA